MKTKVITVITINYNNVIGLKKTMKSVFDQTYTNIEYIVIDGGSKDGSKEFIVDNVDKLAYWVSEPDNGIYNAMNKGIAKATGEYLLFLNSGDYLYSEKALFQFKETSSTMPNKDLYYGKINVIATDNENAWIKPYTNDLSFSYFLKDTLPHPATFIKRSCFDVLLYDESLKIVSDWKFFMIGICKFNFSFHYFDKVITTFFLDGISSTNPKLANEEKNQVLLDDFPLFIKDYNKLKNVENELKLLKKQSKIERILRKIYKKIKG
ncbi:hypothetical protein BTO15_12110 [Polaribacter sejongensis]|uniref:Glycosyltransferase 2-like domain-containing protein n=1 Tax=Polaribacter sejongensis TaxID=985043 RepID=A0ABN5F5L2_9FLAO|nr:glycosyltransferase family 2 protein [Polaribacter sejongensis]AUC22786.1 hypothetical protein BTO15_12110 [Polaribacter sejongensis]